MTGGPVSRDPVIVVGGGPAGLAAAAASVSSGAENVLLLEKDGTAGGILTQCIHDGFGLIRFGRSLTGPEYAARFIDGAVSAGIDVRTGATVVHISPDRTVSFISRSGCTRLKAGAVVLATGCRERTRGALRIPGPRPAGIFTAGTVQNLVNLKNIRIGKSAVILGSGDIGLIMARRLTLEGVEVKAVVERLPHPGGLLRNIVQCIDDYGIPLLLSSTVTLIKGRRRVDGVAVSRLDASGEIIPDSEREIPCDTLILSVGLIPENSLASGAGIELDPVTGGPVVDGRLQTTVPGIFACGNCLHVHDLVDYASAEAEHAGESAAMFLRSGSPGTGTGTGTGYSSPRVAFPLLQPVVPEPEFSAIPNGDGNAVVCTLCPRGCAVHIREDGAGKLSFDGALCPKGREYAKAEITGPLRTLTSTVGVLNGVFPLVSVRSSRPVPKEAILSLAARLRSVKVEAPVVAGRVLVGNIGGTGADIVSTRSVGRIDLFS